MTAAQAGAGQTSAFLPARVLADLASASPLAPLLVATRSLWPRMVERACALWRLFLRGHRPWTTALTPGPPRPIPTTLTASTEAPLQTQLYGFSALVLGGTAESVSLLFLPPQNLIAPVGGQHPRKVQEATQGCVPLITLLWRMRLLIQYHMFSESLLSARHCLVIATVMMNEPEIILAFKQLTIHVRKIAIINFK